MADAVTDPKAAGWKRDPSRRFAGRYWDGSGWTEHVVSDDRVRSTDPLPPAGSRPPEQARSAPVATLAPPAARGPVAAPVEPAAPSPGSVLPAASLADRWRAWPRWVRVGVPVALVIAVVVALTQGGKDETPGAAAGASASRISALGGTARTGQFDVTVYGFKDPQPPGEFLKPSPGTHYVTVDLQLANRGSTQQNFSSLLQIHLFDGSNRQYDPTFGEVAPQAPDGEIPPGQAVRGMAIFEIPDGTTGLRVRVQGSLSAGGVFFALA